VHESSRKWVNYPDLGDPFGPIGHILSLNSRVHPKYKTKYRVSNWAEYDRVENTFFRYKSIIGARLPARHPKSPEAGALIACNILNRMTELGQPESFAICP